MYTPNGYEISVTGPHMHGGLGGPGNTLSSEKIDYQHIFHHTCAIDQDYPQPFLSTRGPCHKCHNKTVSSFFSVPLGFVFLPGSGIGGSV